MKLGNFIGRLHGITQSNQHDIDVFSGAMSSVKPYGLAYHLVPRARKTNRSSWFETTLWAQRQAMAAMRDGKSLPTYDDCDVYLVVFWPLFLWQARFSEPSPLQPAAVALLRALVRFIAQFDVSLAFDIETFHKRWEAGLPGSLENPTYHGQRDSEDEGRFDRHLRRLTNDKAFQRALSQLMRRATSPMSAVGLERSLGLCPKKRHRGMHSCAACKGLRWAHWGASVLTPHRMGDVGLRQRLAIEDAWLPTNFETTDHPWHREFQWWLSCDDPNDGVVRVGNGVLVNFARLAEDAESRGRETPVRTLHAPLSTGDYWMRGHYVREHAAQLFPKLAGDRPAPLQEMVTQAGWNWQETLDLPYEFYSVPALASRLAMARRARAALRLSSRKYNSGPRKVRVAHLEYLDLAGRRNPVSVVLRREYSKLEVPIKGTGRRIGYYTVPYEVTPRMAEASRGNSLTYEGTTYWRLRGINRHVAIAQDHYAFAEWVATIDSEMSEAYFRKLLSGEARGRRIAAVLRGERRNVGPFAASEDRLLEDFFASRPPRKRLSPAEWAALLQLLPGRTRNGIRYRIECLGKKFALQHGWIAYINSSWCLRIDLRRKQNWSQEGMLR